MDGPPETRVCGTPPLARGARFACPALRFRPFCRAVVVCRLKASDPGLLVKIIQGNPQTLMFCLLMLDCPKLWLVALCHPVVFNVAVLVRIWLRIACCMLLLRGRTCAQVLILTVDPLII